MTFGEGATHEDELILVHHRDKIFFPYRYYVARKNIVTGARTLHLIPLWREKKAIQQFNITHPLYPQHTPPTDKYKMSHHWKPN